MESGIRRNNIPPYRHSAFLGWRPSFYTTIKDQGIVGANTLGSGYAEQQVRSVALRQATKAYMDQAETV